MNLLINSIFRSVSPWIWVVATIALVVGSDVVVWNVATWKVEASKSVELAKVQGEKHALEIAIGKQNEAIAVAEAKTQASEAAQNQAKEYAAQLAAFSQSRMDKLASAVESSKGCGDVLARYWELRK